MNLDTISQNQNYNSIDPYNTGKKNVTSKTSLADSTLEMALGKDSQNATKNITQNILNPEDKVSIQTRIAVGSDQEISDSAQLKTDSTNTIKPEYNLNAISSEPITSTLSGGSTVTVFSQGYEREDGSQGSRLMVQVLGINGEKQEFEVTKSTLISEDENNNLLIKDLSTGSREINGTENNDVIISLGDTGATINTIKGDNTIISLSSGNQSSSSLTINGGSGNDTVIAGDLHHSTINLGEGNNSLTAQSSHFVSIRAGDGNNSISIETNFDFGLMARNSTITLGNGDNTVTGSSLGSLSLGDGNNTISAKYLGTVNIGDGNNTISAQQIMSLGTSGVTVGNGNNTITLDLLRGISGDTLTAGNGDNSISIGSLGTKPVKLFVDGILSSESTHSVMSLGDGNNTIELGSVEGGGIYAGNGNNSLTVKGDVEDSSFHFGNGNNTITLQGAVKDSIFNFGSGNNKIQMLGLLKNISVNGVNGGSIDLDINNDTAKDVYVNNSQYN